MPKSRQRTKRPAAVRGIPADLLAKAPANLSASDKAEWCRHYLDGATGRPYRRPRRAGLSDWTHRAYRQGETQGRADAENVAAELKARRERAEARADRAFDARASDLHARLDALSGIPAELRELGIGIADRMAGGLFRR